MKSSKHESLGRVDEFSKHDQQLSLSRSTVRTHRTAPKRIRTCISHFQLDTKLSKIKRATYCYYDVEPNFFRHTLRAAA